ncbi:hypothetical protein D3C80_2092310 [compost metagenome]
MIQPERPIQQHLIHKPQFGITAQHLFRNLKLQRWCPEHIRDCYIKAHAFWMDNMKLRDVILDYKDSCRTIDE